MPPKTVTAAAAAVALLSLSACSSSSSKTTTPTTSGSSGGSPTSSSGGSGGPAPAVTVGSANFPENEILADIYADALQKAGVQASTKLDIGSREVYFKQLQSGTINVFPEYNGALLDYLQPTNTASSTADVDSALASALPSNLEALSPAPAQDSDSITVTSAFAAAHNLKSIADLKPIESSITLGGPPEFATREAGILGLKKLYGITVNFKPLDEAGPLTIAALEGGTVQAADVFTTDPSVAKYHFVALADPLHLFAAENVVPIVNKTVGANSKITSTLNAVSASLTTANLISLVNAVVNDHVDASTVASQYVAQEKLP
jgi:osmoprotectant transport system substrate-binding protein